MIEINLLPVRAARRKESLRFQLSITVLTLIFIVIIIAYLNVSASKQEKKVDQDLQTVRKDLVELNKKVGEIDRLKQLRGKLEQKLSIINDLDKGRKRAAYILGELSQLTPEKVWIETLEKKGKSLKMTGVALDNETIANFMTALGRSKYFGGVELEITEQTNRGKMKLKKFSLHCATAL